MDALNAASDWSASKNLEKNDTPANGAFYVSLVAFFLKPPIAASRVTNYTV
jgi:hypothetical protein